MIFFFIVPFDRRDWYALQEAQTRILAPRNDRELSDQCDVLDRALAIQTEAGSGAAVSMLEGFGWLGKQARDFLRMCDLRRPGEVNQPWPHGWGEPQARK